LSDLKKIEGAAASLPNAKRSPQRLLAIEDDGLHQPALLGASTALKERRTAEFIKTFENSVS
jgi:hypothetical protein